MQLSGPIKEFNISDQMNQKIQNVCEELNKTYLSDIYEVDEEKTSEEKESTL